MGKLRYVFRSINVFNCLLFLVVAVTAYDTVIPWMTLKTRITLPAAGKDAPKATELPAPLQNPSLADYVMISEQNLFHPERRIPPEKKGEKAAIAIPKPELVLYGTLISQDMSIAYIEDKKAPYSTPGRGKRQTQLKKGDSVSGYLLQDIEPNRIVLVKGEDKLVVTLDPQDKKRSGETTAPGTGGRAPAVASPAGAAGKAPVVSSPSQAAQPSATATATPPPAAAVVPSPSPDSESRVPASPPPIRRGLRSPLLPRNLSR